MPERPGTAAARAVATFGYVGLLRPAPGTWGSAVALLLGWALHALGGPVALAVAAALAFAAGLRAVGLLAGAGAQADPDRPEYVIDEVVGQWIALLPVSLGAQGAGVPLAALWPGLLTAFLAFRFFDILKVWPVNLVDRRHDALGVMGDDVVAGLYAALTVLALAALFHAVVMGGAG
jgi:phosphatidylglycerophosphatase A